MLIKFLKLTLSSMFIAAYLQSSNCFAVTEPEKVPLDAAIIEKLGDTIPVDISFKDEHGNDVKIGDYLGKSKPILLTPIYYNCPSLCNYTLNGLLETLKELKLEVGKDFEILSFSINPKEGPKLAKDKKASYISELDSRHNGKESWHFLTGSDDSIKRLTSAIGFQFFPDKDEFAHSAALIVLTDSGVVSRYLYGIKFPEKNVRLSLVEAGEGKIGSTFDRVELFCFTFDPTKGQYTLAIMNLVRVVSVLFLVWLVVFLWRVYKRSEAERGS